MDKNNQTEQDDPRYRPRRGDIRRERREHEHEGVHFVTETGRGVIRIIDRGGGEK